MNNPRYESVIFLKEEAQFVQSTMQAYSQNLAVGGETDQGAAVPVTKYEQGLANSILSKVRPQISNPRSGPISFTEPEAKLMVYLYINYVQGHGKPQGDLDWTYYIRFDTNTQALVQNVIYKLGSTANFVTGSIYPAGGADPFTRL